MMTTLMHVVIFSICGGVCSVWDNLSYLELNQLCFICSSAVLFAPG